jgi:hypothetical protein
VLEDGLAERDAFLGVRERASNAARAMPIDCAPMPILPPSSPDSAIFRPCPSSPRRFAAGTRHFSSTICAVSLACWPTFSSRRATT